MHLQSLYDLSLAFLLTVYIACQLFMAQPLEQLPHLNKLHRPSLVEGMIASKLETTILFAQSSIPTPFRVRPAC